MTTHKQRPSPPDPFDRSHGRRLTEFYVRLEATAPHLVKNLRRARDKGQKAMDWLYNERMAHHPYRAYQHAAVELGQDQRNLLAEDVAANLARHDRQYCRQLIQDPEAAAQRYSPEAELQHRIYHHARNIADTAQAVLNTVDKAVPAITQALIDLDEAAYYAVLKDVSEAHRILTRILTTPGLSEPPRMLLHTAPPEFVLR